MRKLLIAICSLLLCGCSTMDKTDYYADNTPQLQSLQQVENLTAKGTKNADTKSNKIRMVGITNTALSTGAQAGLAWRADQIDSILSKNSKNLDQVFDFNGLLLAHSVLPPILVQGKDSTKLDGPNTLRISNQDYQIYQQAQFVTAPPTWRTYIWMDYKPPETPNSSLLPKNDKEQMIWVKNVRIGWQNGVGQANDIYDQNLGRMKQDFMGMLLYRKLLAQHMVSSPFVAKTNLGVTGDGQHININDRVLRITALPTLQTNSNKWQPVVTR